MSQSRETRLIASASMRYRGRMLHAGDEFDAPEKDAESLVATRFAERVPVKVEKVEKVMDTDPAVAAELLGVEPSTDDATKETTFTRKLRTYKRRDMKAEGE